MNLRVLSCTSTQATLSWQPGSDNHAPITKYSVSYNAKVVDHAETETETGENKTGKTERDIRVGVSSNSLKYFNYKNHNTYNGTDRSSESYLLQSTNESKSRNKEGNEAVLSSPITEQEFVNNLSNEVEDRIKRNIVASIQSDLKDEMTSFPTIYVPSYQRVVRLKLHPNFNYTFTMKAYNSLGWSRSSGDIQGHSYCVTKAVVPLRNPGDVCVRTGEANEVVVTWQVFNGFKILIRC